jgi:hypothetical protein
MQIVFHWQAIGLATVAAWFVYVLWFSPFVFGSLWQRLERLSDESVRAGLLPRLGLAVVVAAAQAVVLAGFFNFTRSSSIEMGALAALQLSLGLFAPGAALIVVMGGRKSALVAIYVGGMVLSQIVAGGLLAGWQ